MIFNAILTPLNPNPLKTPPHCLYYPTLYTPTYVYLPFLLSLYQMLSSFQSNLLCMTLTCKMWAAAIFNSLNSLCGPQTCKQKFPANARWINSSFFISAIPRVALLWFNQGVKVIRLSFVFASVVAFLSLIHLSTVGGSTPLTNLPGKRAREIHAEINRYWKIVLPFLHFIYP